jgi:hypothetical protein
MGEETSMILTHRRIIACWCFLTSVLILFLVSAYFYFDTKYPTSTRYIELNLSSPSIANQSKVEEARKEGYSEKEIAEFLAQRNSQEFLTHIKTVFLIESTVLVIALLVGSGFMILGKSIKIHKP